MLVHVIAHGGCENTARESALKVDSRRKIPCFCWGIEPASVLYLALRSDALPAGLYHIPWVSWSRVVVMVVGRGGGGSHSVSMAGLTQPMNEHAT